jgi:large subunit ribosomal protein L7e
LKETKERRDKDRKDRADARKVITANADKYNKEYTDSDRAIIDAKRSAKNAGNIFVEGEPKLAFLIRTRG